MENESTSLVHPSKPLGSFLFLVAFTENVRFPAAARLRETLLPRSALAPAHHSDERRSTTVEGVEGGRVARVIPGMLTPHERALCGE